MATTGNAAIGQQNGSTARFIDAGAAPASTESGLDRFWGLLSAAQGKRKRETTEHLDELQQDNIRLRKRVEQLTLREANARYLANHDGLTGLCNRSLLMDRFVHAVAHAQRSGEHMALLLLDLDDFKSINDRKGHAAGDHVLQCVAARIDAIARSADTVCRYGGDEFVMLLPGVGTEAAARTVAERVQQSIGDCINVDDDNPITLSISCGIALFPRDGGNWTDLLETADAAMYHCKPAQPKDAERERSFRERWKRRHEHEAPLRMPAAAAAAAAAAAPAAANDQQQLSAGGGDTATQVSETSFDNH